MSSETSPARLWLLILTTPPFQTKDSKDAGIADSKAAQGEVVDNKVADDEAADNKVASTDSEVVDGELQVKGKDGGREYETRYIIAKEIRIQFLVE
ncbi:hypothetical protein BKA61DRAFT_678774 [Leptodontidium sp. MPI-SDFR-AT-0119]|nr:hypothetical protein BKA61DRAFT_678774 [Leptodontidium sp. MPI-SDFR-AT-0119]